MGIYDEQTEKKLDEFTASLRGELPKRVHSSISAAECSPPTLQMGDAHERNVRLGGYDSDINGRCDWPESRTMDSPCIGRGDGVSGLDEGSRKASEVQVGGSHYKSLGIQPSHYNHVNRLGWCEANIVKYATRHKQKHGAKDLAKVIHYAQLLLEWEYGTTYEEVLADE